MAACPPPPPTLLTSYKYHQRAPPPALLCSAIPSLSFLPKDHLPPQWASTYSQAPSASQRHHPSQMAVLNLGCGSDKENAPPPSAARGIAVKRQTMMKRPGGGASSNAPRRRPPLRDITRLFVTAPCPPPSTAVLLALSDAGLPEAVRPGAGGASGGVAVTKQGSHSLRMGFR